MTIFDTHVGPTTSVRIAGRSIGRLFASLYEMRNVKASHSTMYSFYSQLSVF
jgi:hypothetical protein